ncbi:hypothetical protein JW859_04820 [bacterium]|nr:hypothetical protein [bacterium]
MKRAALFLGFLSLVILLGACGGGNDGTTPDVTTGPLTIQLLAVEPASGASPLRVTFTVNISGGLAPYYYAWDYTNDGSFDVYQNNEYRRTLSVQRDYYLKSSDAGGVTQYEAVLRVTDSEGTIVNSDPVQINVLGSTGFLLDDDLTYWFTEKTDDEGVPIAETGKAVHFRAQPVGGTAPYEYQWDFNADGTADSTVAAPQYTFTYTGAGVQLFVVSVTVVDATGEKAYWDFYVPVEGPDTEGGGGSESFEIRLSSNPPATDGVIVTKFDPTGVTDGLPLEPEVDLSVVVVAGSGGVPPYEYYWDFENDGALDSQFTSPSIPYYDSDRKILINPYEHSESTKDFTLKCMVIDSSGQVQSEYRTIRAINNSNVGDIMVPTPTYGVASEGGAFTSTPPLPYATVEAWDQLTYAKFVVDIAGCTGCTFQYQFDGNGDDIPEIPEAGTGWEDIEGRQITVTRSFQGAGYFPVSIRIQALDSSESIVDTATVEVPLSLAIRNTITNYEGTLEPRTNHCIAAAWETANSPANGLTLTQREFIIAGGSQGTVTLNTVDRLVQTFTPPAETGEIETLNGTVATIRPPMNFARRGAVMWNNDPENNPASAIRIHGGAGTSILAKNESSTPGAGTIHWTNLNELLAPEYFPVKDMCGTFIPGTGYMFGGGFHKPVDEDNVVVTSRIISYNEMFDSYGRVTDMPTPRYDACMAYANDRLYVIGGREASGQTVATVEAYDPVTGNWDTYAPSMLEARSGAACQVIGGNIYVIGGAQWPLDSSQRVLLNSAEVLNPQTGVWSYSVPLPLGAQADQIASCAAPAPGGASGATGALVNSIVCFGGEKDAGGELPGGESNQLIEFTYFHVVEPVTD